jgi:CubicO group peptidase (beta-lactamase class C family)
MRSIHKLFVTSFAILLCLSYSCTNDKTKTGTDLPRSTPEAEGVNSEGIIAFLKAAEKKEKHEFHSFMFLRHGKVIAEGWWSPYAPDLKHTLYSTSKSFTSTAVGFAVSDSLIKVSDKVISFFPDDLLDTISPYLADMEIRDLLSMSAGLDPDPTRLIIANNDNWVKAFLATPVINDPGTKFLYNSMATYMLSAIVRKVTGEPVIEYLAPRLFEPLGIKGIDWERCPMGINTGGWGLRLKTEDMAKFGQLYLQKGKWNGVQILSEEWIDEATSFKIDQAPGVPEPIKDSSDWMQGYCYQFWRCRNNAFRADGAYGQYIVVMPDQDAVVAITCESQDLQDELNLVWEYLLPSIEDNKLPKNEESNETLILMLDTLAVKVPDKGISSPLQPEISGKKYKLDDNDRRLQAVTFNFNDDKCSVTMDYIDNSWSIDFGSTNWVTGTTTRPGPNLLLSARNHLAGIPPVQTAGTYRWRNENTLELTLRYIESPHTETIACMFDQDKISIDIKYSYIPGEDFPDLTGHHQEY